MIKLQGSKVAVVPVENPDKIGSLYIPEMAKDRLNQGFVKYRGPLTRHVKIGDYVLFSGYTGTLMHMEGEGKLIILPEKFIIAVVPELENKEVPGLYLKDKVNHAYNISDLAGVISDVLPELEYEVAQDLAAKLDKRGVVADYTAQYFTAQYELAMQYIAQAFGEDPAFRDSIKVVNANPHFDLDDEERAELVKDAADEDEDEYDAQS